MPEGMPKPSLKSEDIIRDDVEKSREIANLHNKAEDLEAAYVNEIETGLTKEQETNMGVVDYIEREYPNACERIIYKVGGKEVRGALVRNESGAVEPGQDWYAAAFFTRNGIFLLRSSKGLTPDFFEVNKEDFAERIDWTVENYKPSLGRSRDALPSSDEWEEFPGTVLSKRDLGNKENKEFLSKLLLTNEKHRVKVNEKSGTPELESLVEGL